MRGRYLKIERGALFVCVLRSSMWDVCHRLAVAPPQMLCGASTCPDKHASTIMP